MGGGGTAGGRWTTAASRSMRLGEAAHGREGSSAGLRFPWTSRRLARAADKWAHQVLRVRAIRDGGGIIRRLISLALGVACVVAVPSRAGAADVHDTAASWHVVSSVLAHSGPGFSSFTAVTAQTTTSAWAFESTASASHPIAAWKLTGSTWAKVAFPENDGASVVAATGKSPTSVFAATSRGTLLTWGGAEWRPVSKFAAISDIAATGAGDLWVSGRRTPSRASAGLWHLVDGVWHHASVTAYGAIDAVSDDAIFSVTSTSVEEFVGNGWKSTSLAALLPAKQPLCQLPSLDSVVALTSSDLWVTAQGGCQDFGGPFRLLHGVGSSWSVAADRGLGRGVAYRAGGGSLWIPTDVQGNWTMLRLSHGTLTTVALPMNSGGDQLELLGGVATPPGSSASIAVGSLETGGNFNGSRGVILRYGT